MTTCVEQNEVGVVTGDVNESAIATLGGVENLSTASAFEAHVLTGGEGYTRKVATLGVTLVDATARTVRIDFGALLGWLPAAAVKGTWMLEVEVHWPDGTEKTWPTPGSQDDPPRVVVRDQYA